MTTTKLNTTPAAPIIEMTPRIQDLFMLVNTSRRMPTEKIVLLNEAMREFINDLKSISTYYPEIKFRLRLITFSDRAQWHIDPTDIQEPEFSVIEARSNSAEAGMAVKILAEFLASENMPRRSRLPILVLISDGHHSDEDTYDEAIQQLDDTPYGNKAIRLSVGLGADSNWKQLGKFSNAPDIGILELSNENDLAGFFRSAALPLILGGNCHCVAEPHMQVHIPMNPELSRDNSATEF